MDYLFCPHVGTVQTLHVPFMITVPEKSLLPTTLSAIEKFYALNDDFDAMQALNRRTLFEFLRTKPTLSVDEIDMLWSISELLADLSLAKRTAPNA